MLLNILRFSDIHYLISTRYIQRSISIKRLLNKTGRNMWYILEHTA